MGKEIENEAINSALLVIQRAAEDISKIDKDIEKIKENGLPQNNYEMLPNITRNFQKDNDTISKLKLSKEQTTSIHYLALKEKINFLHDDQKFSMKKNFIQKCYKDIKDETEITKKIEELDLIQPGRKIDVMPDRLTDLQNFLTKTFNREAPPGYSGYNNKDLDKD